MTRAVVPVGPDSPVVPGPGADAVVALGADRDAGAVTVEAALGICSVVSVFALALTGMSMVIGHLRCTDAAVEAARQVARGAPDQASDAVAHLAPKGARLAITAQGDRITAEVSSPPPVGFLPEQVSRARAVLEPGAPPVPQRHDAEPVPR